MLPAEKCSQHVTGCHKMSGVFVHGNELSHSDYLAYLQILKTYKIEHEILHFLILFAYICIEYTSVV